MRNIATYRKEHDWTSLRGLLEFALRLTLTLAVIVTVIVLTVAWLTYEFTGRPALLKADQAELAQTAFYTLLIPAWGVKGSAVAGALSVSVSNLAMVWIVIRQLKINPTALGNVRAWKIWKT